MAKAPVHILDITDKCDEYGLEEEVKEQEGTVRFIKEDGSEKTYKKQYAVGTKCMATLYQSHYNYVNGGAMSELPCRIVARPGENGTIETRDENGDFLVELEQELWNDSLVEMNDRKTNKNNHSL